MLGVIGLDLGHFGPISGVLSVDLGLFFWVLGLDFDLFLGSGPGFGSFWANFRGYGAGFGPIFEFWASIWVILGPFRGSDSGFGPIWHYLEDSGP